MFLTLRGFVCLALAWIAQSSPFLYAQFALDVISADQAEMQIFVPGGAVDRELVCVLDGPDTIRFSLTDCSQSCIRQLTNLTPSLVAYCALTRGSDTLSRVWGITSSLSSGDIEVYFTTDVDPELSELAQPDGLGGSVLEETIIDRISRAQFTIDVALYNINRRSIVNALTASHQRGVRVRYVTGDDTSNTALRNPSPSFPILQGNIGDPLMHHKFFVIDAGSDEHAWVITGATNMTTFQMFEDHNNTVMINDRSLARVYELEMDEMWGGQEQMPNVSLSRFGSLKTNNTPHKIFIQGQLIESYFSPSDNTSFHITNALNRAQSQVGFALLTFTRNSIANSIINLKNRGVQVRGIIENIDDSGSEFDRLRSNGVFVLPHPPSQQLHHKYAVVDPVDPEGRALVITGSHNWTNNAEQNNDENTLIIHDPIISRIFWSEFQARWCEVFPGESADCRLTTSSIVSHDKHSDQLRVHYDGAQIVLHQIPFSIAALQVFDTNGKLIKAKRFMNRSIPRELIQSFFLGSVPSGTYFLVIESDEKQLLSTKFVAQ